MVFFSILQYPRNHQASSARFVANSKLSHIDFKDPRTDLLDEVSNVQVASESANHHHHHDRHAPPPHLSSYLWTTQTKGASAVDQRSFIKSHEQNQAFQRAMLPTMLTAQSSSSEPIANADEHQAQTEVNNFFEDIPSKQEAKEDALVQKQVYPTTHAVKHESSTQIHRPKSFTVGHSATDLHHRLVSSQKQKFD
jgi:hypothetical protein